MSAALGRRLAASSLTIGEVLGVLREQFPDVSISKIRFLEEQGLVEPDRTPSGYRKFSDAHVVRLRHVLTLQRDHFLPLRVIREQLAHLDEQAAEASDDDVTGVTTLHGVRDGAVALQPREPLDRRQLGAASGADDALVAELLQHGLIGPRPPRAPGDEEFGPDDVEVARAAAALSSHGVHARHLRMFRSAADKEVDLVEQVVAPIRRTARGGSDSRAQETAREVAAGCLRLHAALVASRLGSR